MDDKEKMMNGGGQHAEGGGNSSEAKTFTQDELNALIGDRLKKEREKFADYEELKKKASEFDKAEDAKKTELQKAQEALDTMTAERDRLLREKSVAEIRANVAKETGVPANLLTAETEEEAKAQAEAILAFKGNGSGYHYAGDSGESAPPTTDFSKIQDIKDSRARVRALEEAIKAGADVSKLIK